MFIIILLLALPILVVLFLLHERRNYFLRPPGPAGLPFIGNLHQMDNSAPHIKLSQLAHKHGPFMSLKLGTHQTLVVSSSKIMKDIVTNHDLTFSGRPSFIGQQKLSHKGLNVAFSPCNDYWKEMKKIYLNNFLSNKIVKSFRGVREAEVSSMMKNISLLADSSELVNVSQYLIHLTNNLMCRTAFGTRYGDGEGKQIGKILVDTEDMVGSMFVSDYFPMLSWVDTLTGKFSKLEKTFKELELFYDQIIEEHLSKSAQKPEPREQDFVDALLQLRNDPSAPINITLDHIKAVLMDIFIGGTGTSANISTWVMTMLVKHPKVMAKVQLEVRMAIGTKGVVDEDDLHQFIYLKAVIKEVFRMYPPVGMVHRETIDKCSINGYQVSPKTHVLFNIWAIGRDSEVWENPEDFTPERFLESTMDVRGNDYGLVPFGSGRRMCPGLNLAIPTYELAISNLLYSFDWELPNGMTIENIDTEVLPGITMHKKNDLCLLATNYSCT